MRSATRPCASRWIQVAFVDAGQRVSAASTCCAQAFWLIPVPSKRRCSAATCRKGRASSGQNKWSHRDQRWPHVRLTQSASGGGGDSNGRLWRLDADYEQVENHRRLRDGRQDDGESVEFGLDLILDGLKRLREAG